MDERFKLDNQLCFRLYSASRLMTQAYTPLLSEHGLTYPQYLVLMVLWEKDEQPVNDIARLTQKGVDLQKQLTGVPEAMACATLCESVNESNILQLFGMLDGIIRQLQKK